MNYLRRELKRIWEAQEGKQGSTALALLLRLLEIPYRLGMATRNELYARGLLRTARLSCPVISIGNITTGGTGKTPLTIWLARLLKEKGYRPAVLSRGYGGRSKEAVTVVTDGREILADYREAGDEPLLIAQSLQGVPVLTGPRRFVTGTRAIKEFGADVLILDDGFQHRQLYRDLDIVLLDQEKPVGNGQLLPAGPLREPPAVLNRADIFILTGGAGGAEAPLPGLPALRRGSPVFHCYRKPVSVRAGKAEPLRPLSFLKGKKVYAFAGIAQPQSFCRTLKQLQASIAGFSAFADHHAFTPQDIEKLQAQARRSQAELLITTEKDAVRLGDFKDFLDNIFILTMESALLPNDEAFGNLLLQMLRRTLS